MKHLLITIAAVVLVGCGPNIHEAAKTGNIKAVKQHLDAGADVNAKNKVGQTPLHRAALYSQKEIVELLIAKGANMNARGFFGMTPLNMADDEGEKEIANLLRKHGAKTAEELKAEQK